MAEASSIAGDSAKVPEDDSFSLEGKGVLLHVFHQGKCGCCYAVVVTEAISAMVAISTNQPPVALSVQQVIDYLPQRYRASFAKKQKDSSGCYSSETCLVYQHAMKDGLCREVDYPYRGERVEAAIQSIDDKKKIKIAGYKRIPYWDCTLDKIRERLQTTPITGMMDARESFLYFNGVGIYMGYDSKEKFEGLHAVLIIGCGVQGEVEYYIIKNSWGPHWGNKGYAKVKRNQIDRLEYPFLE